VLEEGETSLFKKHDMPFEMIPKKEEGAGQPRAIN
jgi:hypothetical protein